MFDSHEIVSKNHVNIIVVKYQFHFSYIMDIIIIEFFVILIGFQSSLLRSCPLNYTLCHRITLILLILTNVTDLAFSS